MGTEQEERHYVMEMPHSDECQYSRKNINELKTFMSMAEKLADEQCRSRKRKESDIDYNPYETFDDRWERINRGGGEEEEPQFVDYNNWEPGVFLG